MTVPTLHGGLAGAVRSHASRPALIHEDGTVVSFAELLAAARRAAGALAALGAGRGTRVGLLMPNRPAWLAAAFGTWMRGAVLVPVNTLFGAGEIAETLRVAGVEVLVTVDRFLRHDYLARIAAAEPALAGGGPGRSGRALPALRAVAVVGESVPPWARSWRRLARESPEAAPVPLPAQADAAIFFTSGSTGSPKGVVHTHASLLHAARGIGERLGVDPDDRVWGYLPFFFAGGLVAVALAGLLRGACVILQEVFDAGRTLDLLERHGCTTFFAWPHQADALLRHPRFARARLRIRKGVGANAEWASGIYPPGHQAVGTWGMTETASIATACSHDDPPEWRAGSHGRPLPGLELRIVEPGSGAPLPVGREGEIAVRGPSLFRAYCGPEAPAARDAEGFFRTGDLGRLDGNGCLHFLGRLKDVIKTAGVNVSPAEIEGVLARHPAVEVAHVVPVPHPRRGENVAAFVVTGRPCDARELEAHCRRHLAAYKVPRHWFFVAVEDLPLLGSGKVDRRRLRELAAERARG